MENKIQSTISRLSKFNDLSFEARDNSFLQHQANTDAFAVYRFIDSLCRTMSYGHGRPVSPERVIRLAGNLIDVINADIEDYESSNPQPYVEE